MHSSLRSQISDRKTTWLCWCIDNLYTHTDMHSSLRSQIDRRTDSVWCIDNTLTQTCIPLSDLRSQTERRHDSVDALIIYTLTHTCIPLRYKPSSHTHVFLSQISDRQTNWLCISLHHTDTHAFLSQISDTHTNWLCANETIHRLKQNHTFIHTHNHTLI